jgi:hypothetical protein
MFRVLFLVLVATVLTAVEPAIAKEPLEPLLGVRCTTKDLTFSVYNKGYTNKASFKLVVQPEKDTKVVSVFLVRVTADDGKMMPEPIEVAFPLADNGITRANSIRVVNAIIPDLPAP